VSDTSEQPATKWAPFHRRGRPHASERLPWGSEELPEAPEQLTLGRRVGALVGLGVVSSVLGVLLAAAVAVVVVVAVLVLLAQLT